MHNDGKPNIALGLYKQSIAIVTLVIITLLSLDIMMDYKNHQSQAQIQLEQKLALINHSLAQTIAANDPLLAEDTLKQLLKDPKIYKASISINNNQAFGDTVQQQMVQLDESSLEYRSIDLTLPFSPEVLGSLRLAIDNQRLVDTFLKRTVAMTIISILGISLLGMLLYFLIDHRLNKPLKTILAHMARWKSNQMPEPIKVPTHHEFNELGMWLQKTNLLISQVRENRSKQSAARAHASQLRRFDELTDLPNGDYFHEQLRQRIKIAHNLRQKPVLMLIGMDGFSEVNDQYGKAIGDKLLVAITKRLSRHQVQNQFLARVAGDQFALLAEHIEHSYDAGQLAQSILHALARPFSINDKRVQISASIGITLYPQDGRTAESLMANAQKAMTQAKKEGRNQFQYYLASTDANMRRRKKIEDALRTAPQTGQLNLVFQPLFDLERSQVNGAEVLIRWNHPELGNVSPDEFIPIAEKSRLIVPIGAWVINTACQQLARWQHKGHMDFTMAVNVSAVQLKHPTLVSTVKTAIEQNDVPPESLVIEITETAVIDNIEDSIDKLHELRDLGVKIALDDFGTGYSSLNYLKRLPLDKLKIDRSFIEQSSNHPRDQLIINSIVQLAHNLELSVVAEGVESYEQHQFLSGLMCAEGQGYFYSPPLKVNEFQELIFDSNFIDTSSNIYFNKRQSEVIVS